VKPNLIVEELVEVSAGPPLVIAVMRKARLWLLCFAASTETGARAEADGARKLGGFPPCLLSPVQPPGAQGLGCRVSPPGAGSLCGPDPARPLVCPDQRPLTEGKRDLCVAELRGKG